VARPTEKWTNLQEGHELYCAGHMIEAAVAYYEATGKTELLTIVKKNVDLIYHRFVEEGREGVPGHPEIELALVRLYRVTKEKKYLELAKHFIDARGQDRELFVREKKARSWTSWNSDPYDTDYTQNSHPVREETNAVGHAVRALYLCTGMAMTAAETKDKTLVDACKKWWNSVTKKRMYITGGVGNSAPGEAFTEDYFLPNDLAYNETCASIALIFFAREMAAITNDASYVDVMERALYNTVLASMQLDGKHFFYTNPLEVNPNYAHIVPVLNHVYPRRPKWHGCACCPPNAARLITSLDRYTWHQSNGIFYSDLMIGGTYRPEEGIEIEVESSYVKDGQVTYHIRKENDKSINLAIRVPAWSKETKIEVNGVTQQVKLEHGYQLFSKLESGTVIHMQFDFTPHKIYANPNVAADLGKCAIVAGPFTYCFEDTDNKVDVNRLFINALAEPIAQEITDTTLGETRKVTIPGYYYEETEALYLEKRPKARAIVLTAVPYYAWGNRSEGSMKVWLPEK
ncbi:MAG: glycoside hydrolase family 127 protein, partial [bacterium]|nr:glycoside hydrolase family 127 protein [bacterium]